MIGINGRGSFEKRGRVNVGVGYAISIQQVRNFLGTLKSGRILDHAGLGFVVSTARDGSVRISEISSKSDAYRQGLRYDSRILAATGLIGGGETSSVTFSTAGMAGSAMTFFCTFPGHSYVMKGKFSID